MNEPVDVPTNTVNRSETESSTKPSTHSPRSRIDAVPMNEPVDVPTNTVNRSETKPSTHSSHPSNETKTLA
jgi:hypothetical protein